jgi:hypothetical protein
MSALVQYYVLHYNAIYLYHIFGNISISIHVSLVITILLHNEEFCNLYVTL